MTVPKINIAIDGYAACGKSSTAKAVAHRLNYVYIDSGAMYRAFTFFLLEQGFDAADNDRIEQALPAVKIELLPMSDEKPLTVLLNGHDVTREIRSTAVNALVSEVSSHRAVRAHMVRLQRMMGLTKGVVMDGRDIGTVVFPEAELKVFMTASLDVRVARRRIELEQSGGAAADEEDIRNNLEKRDWQDTHRAESPLRRAEDARLLDTTNLSFQQQVETILQWVTEILENQFADR